MTTKDTLDDATVELVKVIKSLLTKEDILNANDLETQEVHVPEWGGSVLVSSISGHAKDKLELSFSSKTTIENVRARIVAMCLVDDNGNLLFNDSDIVKLGKKSAKALDRVFNVAQKLNAIGDKEVEELAKN